MTIYHIHILCHTERYVTLALVSATQAIYHTFRFVLLHTYFRKKKMDVNSKSIAKRIFFYSSRRFDCILPLNVFASDPYNEISVSKPLSVHSLVLTPVTCIHNSTYPYMAELKRHYAIVSICLVRSKWPNHNFVPRTSPIFHTHTDCTHSALF